MKKAKRGLKYEEKLERCEQFIKEFEDYDQMEYEEPYANLNRKKYMIRLQQIANQEQNTLEILMEDLESFFRKDDQKQLVEEFKKNTLRYITIFQNIADKLMPSRNMNINPENEIKHRFENIIKEQRRDNYRMEAQHADNEVIPTKTYREYDVNIVYGPGSKLRIESISDFGADKIGALVVCKAVVVRVTEVKPELVVATYACDSCGCENYHEVNNDQFGPLVKCQSAICKQNGVNGKLSFLPGHSKFISYQDIKIQETPDQLKQGKIPKNFSIQVRGNLVQQASPGDYVIIQGVLICTKKQGKSEYDLAFNTNLKALKIIREKKKYVEMNIDEERRNQVEAYRKNHTEEHIYEKLARSIAPEIYGLENVKKALLLLLAGGVTKTTEEDNLKIRGEINIALFGDPGIAKSQLLKHISYLAPRGVYTTGKGSSGVGLTAAVVKDPYTHELALQAGALVLADMGVCCIDEFDKMDQYDRTAIHEVMQQQTISIAKAGITTTLNARTSILAAANPLYGRYNKTVSPHKNINLPAALMSRFDLIFILLDSSNKEKDIELAKHIGLVHKLGRAPYAETEVFSPEFIRTYISMAKDYEPVLTPELHHQIIERYVSKRKQQMDLSKQGENYTTMRSLLALVRLAQARAKLRFSTEVTENDVNESLLLIEESQISVSNTKFDSRKDRATDPVSYLFTMFKDLCSYNKRIDYDLLYKRVISRGFSEEQLHNMLSSYERLNLLMRSSEGGKDYITLVE